MFAGDAARRKYLPRIAPYLVISGLAGAVSIVLIKIDAFDLLYAVTRRHESWNLDEILISAFSALTAFLAMAVVRMGREIRSRRDEERRARRRKRHDKLTGLPNRRFFEEELGRRISEARRRETPLAVALIDVDGLNRINNLHGYEAGDHVLRCVAERVRRTVRLHDVVVRLDGDEFAVIFTMEGKAGETMNAAERILARISEPLVIDGARADVTASLGVAIYPTDAEDSGKLLQHAAFAMRQARDSSGNRVAFYDATVNDSQRAYLDLQSDIRRAVGDGEFVPHFQPLISLQDERLDGFEVLARWNHPRRGLLPPAEFTAAAEDALLICDVFWQILRRSCETARNWPRPLSISVNVSPVQFTDEHLGDKILKVLDETGFSAERLVIEITENALIADLEATRNAIAHLRAHGIRFSLDDFGTGYSSLQYLHQLPFDTIKIDRSFVASFGQSHESALIVSSTIALCRSLGLKTVAEGVENEPDMVWLKSLGCTFAQGFLYSRPVSAADATRLVEVWGARACNGAMTLDAPAEDRMPAAARA